MHWITLYSLLIFAAISCWYGRCNAALNAGCECVTFQGTSDKRSGTFTSPNYPHPYRSHINCILYVFIAPPYRSLVEIFFEDLDLGEVNEYGNCNSGDKLRVYLEQQTPLISAEARHHTQICGNISTMLSHSFYSRTGVLILELETVRNTLQHRGFKGTYSFLNPKEFETDGVRQQNTQCTYSIHAGDKEGRIFSPQYPENYPPNSNCAWMFRGDWNERVYISFIKIELAYWGMSNFSTSPDNIIRDIETPRTCDFTKRHNDLLTVYDGDSTEDPVIGRYCGSMPPEELRSTANRMLVTFTSNRQEEALGFAALFKFVQQESEKEAISCDLNFNSDLIRKGVVTSDGYPNPYRSISCLYQFYGRRNERIAIKFIDFDLGGGDMSGTGCALNDRLIAGILVNDTNHLTLRDFCGSQLPLGIMSNGPYLRIKFEPVTANPQTRGYKLEFEFIKDFGIKSDSKQNHIMPCVNEYHAKVRLKGEVVSPNYPSYYPKDTLCTYYFYGDGKNIRLQFKHFDVNGYPPQCLVEMRSDYISLSNFKGAEDKKLGSKESLKEVANITPWELLLQTLVRIHRLRNTYLRLAPLLDSYNGYQMDILSQTYESDSDFYQITFRSCLYGSGTGFRAVYEFVEPEITTQEQVISNSRGSNIISNKYLLLIVAIVLTIHSHASVPHYYT